MANARARVFGGRFFRKGPVSAIFFFFNVFNFAKSNQITEGIRQPLLLHRSKMNDFTYGFMKHSILML